MSVLSDKVAGDSAATAAVQVVTGIAAARGDIAEGIGQTSGSNGGQVGDIIVTVDPATTRGAHGLYVLECKDRRLSVRAILDELKTAAENRDAHAAIGVFSLPEQCPVEEPFTIFDNRAIVLYDKNSPRRLRAAPGLHVGPLGCPARVAARRSAGRY